MVWCSLGIVALRLLGEFKGWGAPWVGERGRDAGGGGALLGITWLMPIAGVLLGWRLRKRGEHPRKPRRAALLALIGLGLLLLGAWVGVGWITLQEDGVFALMIGATLGGSVAFVGWPALCRQLLVYGFAVRMPIILLTFVAVHLGWGTHLEKPHPDIPLMPPLRRAIGLSLAQAFFWVPATVIFGALAGAVVAMLPGKRPEGAAGKL